MVTLFRGIAPTHHGMEFRRTEHECRYPRAPISVYTPPSWISYRKIQTNMKLPTPFGVRSQNFTPQISHHVRGTATPPRRAPGPAPPPAVPVGAEGTGAETGAEPGVRGDVERAPVLTVHRMPDE